MNKLTPLTAATVTGGVYIGNEEQRSVIITGAAYDNRAVKPGNMFVCIRGARTDGHLYANSAFDAGASCCLAEQEIPDARGAYILVESTTEAIKKLAEFHRSCFKIPVIGITGSVGKTTMKELIASVFGTKTNVKKTYMNRNNELGVSHTLMSISDKHGIAVIEMGISDFGEMSRLAKMVRPDIFIITNIGYSHTKELGDLDGVLKAKAEAFAYMNPGSVAVLNGDDKMLRNYDPGIKKITFGRGDGNDYRSENVKASGVDSVTMDIVSAHSRLRAQINAYGSHLATLTPAAVAVAHLLGYQDTEICKGLSRYTNIDGRSNVSIINGTYIIDDCYNANPGSVKAALVSLSQLQCRKVAILGDMKNLGETSGQLHFDIGRFAYGCGIDLLICHGEESNRIAEGYRAVGGETVEHFSDINTLLGEIPLKIKKGDAVLVKASHDMNFDKVVSALQGIISGLK